MIIGSFLRLTFGLGLGFYLTYTTRDSTHYSIKKNVVSALKGEKQKKDMNWG
jgi:hypothetical protein